MRPVIDPMLSYNDRILKTQPLSSLRLKKPAIMVTVANTAHFMIHLAFCGKNHFRKKHRIEFFCSSHQ